MAAFTGCIPRPPFSLTGRRCGERDGNPSALLWAVRFSALSGGSQGLGAMLPNKATDGKSAFHGRAHGCIDDEIVGPAKYR